MRRLLVLLSAVIFVAAAQAQPEPHPANPQLQAAVAQINADTLLANITRLTQFFTRHTYSDTTSDSIGVGAAIRWVHQKGESYDNSDRVDWEQFPWAGTFGGNPVTRNILIARISGISGDSARYVIGGHLDSRTASLGDNTGNAPGADDNGSSCAALLEMLRVLPDSLAHKLELIWFTGEEQGLLGSEAYAQHLAQTAARVDGMIGMDMLGHIVLSTGQIDSSSLRMYAQGPSGSYSRGLQRYLKWVGEAYAGQDSFLMRIIPQTDRPGRGGDHMSFSGNGYPAVRVMETNEDVAFQHNPTDVPSNMSPRYARHVAMCAYGGLLTMLMAPTRPAPPQVVEANGALEITIPDSVTLPPAGHFYLTMRRLTDTYFRWIINLDTARHFAWVPDTNATFAFSVSRSDVNDLPSPFSADATIQILAAGEPGPALPSELSLGASPNPFNGEVTLTLEIARAGNVRLEIFDLLGRRVETLLNESRQPGVHQVSWAPHELASGAYIARFSALNQSRDLKIEYIK